MDVEALLGLIERVSQQSQNDPGDLHRALDALKGKLEGVQQWLRFADVQTLNRLKICLGQVGHTVNVALERARHSLASDPGDTPADQVRISELTRCSTDIRECALLIHFTLCQFSLPADSPAQNETEDLRVAARILQDAQRRFGSDRVHSLQARRPSNTTSSSLRRFLEQVVELETRLLDDSSQAVSGVDSSQRSNGSFGSRTLNDRAELHLPQETGDSRARGGEALGFIPQARTRSRQAPYPSSPQEIIPIRRSPSLLEKTPPRPPKVPLSDSPSSSSLKPKKAIPRRPVARASTTPVTSSVAEEAQPPITPTSPSRWRSRTMSIRIKPRTGRRTGTRELFTQASRSLSHLTYELDTPVVPDEVDLPPPYIEDVHRAAPPRNEKRPHADSVSSNTSRSLSTFALVQDNLVDELGDRVGQGRSINEVDPLTKRTVLMEAADLERTNIITTMLKRSNQVHSKDLDGNTALHFASVRGNATISRALLDYDASVEDYNREGETPITLAARGGHTDAVDCLLNAWTIQRGTAAALTKGYLAALKSGNVNTVAAFIERHIKPKKIKESVLCAAEGGSVPALDYILAQKASLKERSPEGWSGLHFAAEKGHIAMVEKLLALGLSWKAQTKKIGETALAIAIRNRQIATANALILHKDAKVNRDDNDRVTPLHHAVRIGELGLMTALLNAGAKLDVQSKYGWTIMNTAAAYGHTHIVAELITRGFTVEEKLADAEFSLAQKTNEGARRGYWAEIRWPHTNARPLHLSLEFGQDEVANLLIAAGAKIDVADGKGWRPLHHAAFACRPALVELLLSKGASPHATTDDNNTPLGLGFRAHGLDASEEDKIRVWELLQGAMNATKKSKRKQFADFMSASSAGKHVEKRNRAWHTAELAASLHLEEQEEDGASEESSELTVGTGDQREGQYDECETLQTVSRTSFPPDVKSFPR